jgi:hypothetical protein
MSSVVDVCSHCGRWCGLQRMCGMVTVCAVRFTGCARCCHVHLQRGSWQWQWHRLCSSCVMQGHTHYHDGYSRDGVRCTCASCNALPYCYRAAQKMNHAADRNS